MRVVHGVLLVVLVVVGLGPILWLAKSALTPTQDTLRLPLALFPHGIEWSTLATAWNRVQISRYFGNTLIVAVGSWACQMLVATTGGYVLSVLRPRYGKVIQWLVLATLFVPAVVLLIPLYLTILHPPLIGHSLLNSFWAVRLPALSSYIQLDVFLAALAISTAIPIVLFLVFQRLFLRGAGLSGAVKG